MRTKDLLRGFILTALLILFALAISTCGGEQKTPTGGLSALNTENSAQPRELEDSPGKVVFGEGKGKSHKPVSVPGAFPTAGGVPMLAHLFDDGSYDPNGEIVKWEWNFSDQHNGKGGWHDYTPTGGDAWHTYTHPGTAVAHLRVTDNDGNKDTAFVKIKLTKGGNANPVAVPNADPLSGTAPLTVNFTAEGSYDPDGTIVKYEWDFGEGAGFQDFTEDEGAAEFTYTTGGLYTAILRVTDDDEATSTASEEIDVNSPPVAVANADPTEGSPPLTVSFSAEGSSDPDGAIVKYEWDFGDGAGFEDFTPTGGSTEYTYESAGTYTAVLRVTDDDGAEDTDSMEIEVLNAATWHIVVPDSCGSVGNWTSLTVVNGNPAISYYSAYCDDACYDLKYVRATSADGSTWGSPVTPDSAGTVGQYSSLMVVNGNPAISYYDCTNNDLKYVRASDANGSSWGTPQTVDNAGKVGQYTSLAVVNGNPAISYYDYTNQDLKYVRAIDANGGSWGTPQIPDSAGYVGYWTSLATVNGNPAISYWDGSDSKYDLKYVRATDTDGSTWGSPVTPDSAWRVGEYTSLAVVNGNPAISYYCSTPNNYLKYVRANDPDGGSWGTPRIPDSAWFVGYYTSITVVNGTPAISYYDSNNDDLKFVWADDANGDSWGSPETVDSTGIVGAYTSLAVVNGSPAISYRGDTLKFAIYY